MATPFGHTLMGLAVGQLGAPRSLTVSWRWYLFAIVAANAADLDFLPGLVVGDMNRYHHLASHSLGATAIFGIAVWLIVRRFSERAIQVAALGALMYSSHILVDYISEDSRLPYGIPVFWPLSEQFYVSPWTVLGGVKHGVPGDALSTVMHHIFSWHNLTTLGIEAIVVLPVFVAAWWVNRVRISSR